MLLRKRRAIERTNDVALITARELHELKSIALRDPVADLCAFRHGALVHFHSVVECRADQVGRIVVPAGSKTADAPCVSVARRGAEVIDERRAGLWWLFSLFLNLEVRVVNYEHYEVWESLCM